MLDTKFIEMAKTLCCILGNDEIVQILLGEQWTIEEINSFIETCEN